MQITLGPAAIAALDALSSKDKAKVLRSLQLLEIQELKDLALNYKVKKLHSITIEKYYSLRATQDLRIIFEISQAGTVNVLDIVRHSQLERLYKRLIQ